MYLQARIKTRRIPRMRLGDVFVIFHVNGGFAKLGSGQASVDHPEGRATG